MAQNFRKAIRGFRPHDISNVAKIMSQKIRGYYDPQDIKYSGIRASGILEDVLAERGFNDYSGNLSRSYYVRYRRDGASYVFTSNDNAAKQPIIRQTKSHYLYYLTKKRHSLKRKSPSRRTWHLSKRDIGGITMRKTHYRVFRPHIESGPGEYRYLDRLHSKSSPNRGFRRYNGKDVFIRATYEIGNDTPYAQFPESKGYNVLNPRTANRIKKEIEKETMGELKIAVKNMCYDISKKGYVGWMNGRK